MFSICCVFFNPSLFKLYQSKQSVGAEVINSLYCYVIKMLLVFAYKIQKTIKITSSSFKNHLKNNSTSLFIAFDG